MAPAHKRKGDSPRGKRSDAGTAQASRERVTEQHVAGDWRAATLARMRMLIRQADPEVVESVKWRKPSNSMRGVPVWSHAGMICTGEIYAQAVKLTFARGASLPDPSGLFNSSLEGNTRRAIDIREGDSMNETAFKALVRAAVALNSSGSKGQSGGATARRSSASHAQRGPRSDRGRP